MKKNKKIEKINNGDLDKLKQCNNPNYYVQGIKPVGKLKDLFK